MTTTAQTTTQTATAAQPRTAIRTLTADEVAAFRSAVRADLPAAGAPGASPVHAFVLAHTLADATVRDLAAAEPEPEPVSVVHLGQDIRIEQPLLPGERITVGLDVAGARREPRGTRVAVRARLTGEDGTPRAELLTSALLMGATAIEPFGQIPSPAAPAPSGGAGEPAAAEHRLTPAWISGYAHASGDLNPIHLDDRAAQDAGFPRVIAHGMSVLALAVEEIADRYADGDVTRVVAVSGRFSAPVVPDVPLGIELAPDADRTLVRFTCRTPSGIAVKSGWAQLAGRRP
ncbi:MaoC family dehydratase [Streptomyces sp. SID9727]|uniref:MaoC family dehydratase n=1 Tax=Streptomyces sp. SID9727 TaxID=2706114 RepID=UPI0013CB4827|nr:MaoC family dehydratase [Streptomyces sp. SID9727]NEC69453.1 MaoC family dehydratase [Streptomyces sp. SID9727]